ncbi:SWIM zinc finger family protein [Paenibacillus hexagrammi]|uniref:SWIM zinc finger family protein n=1 Tax=Paenibacillus hexagrammi TaxID=2908839 RepID=A0ABY3SI21_9BACL|nr:SWIM zinc finger family protein [Paenibacillus sp. YPD9-1]UJF32607.1 SWIM zinc finger family protein [Paenibacillus sp. YPD9-1]
MGAVITINDEHWTRLLEFAAKSFNEVTLSRGFNYFKQLRIETLSLSDYPIVKAKVTGTGSYKVTLNMDKPKISSCTCPVQSACKHLAAVMMELGDRYGYPASQMVNAKHFQKRAVATPALLLEQLPGMDVWGWHDLMERATAHIKPAYDQGIYVEMIRQQLRGLWKESSPLTDTDRIYFELHQRLFILRKIKQQNASGSVNYYTSFAVYRVYDDIFDWIRSQDSGLIGTDSHERLVQTLQYVRGLLTEETGHKLLEYKLYTEIWKQWVKKNEKTAKLVSQELLETEALAKAGSPPSPSLSAVLAFLYMQDDRELDAWAAIENSGLLKHASGDFLQPFMDHLIEKSKWDSLLQWLRQSFSVFDGKPRVQIDLYIRYWQEVLRHIPQAEQQMWTVLEQMLPSSLPVLEDLLYEQRKWKVWIEMQIIQGVDPLSHRVSVLQPIEKEMPSLLLPYYHQAIAYYVGLKNRYDYKQAVKLLKRLEKVYKKMKQIGVWESFFADFVERNSRLRALLEELRKGKLLE